jgi:hypothetical protein
MRMRKRAKWTFHNTNIKVGVWIAKWGVPISLPKKKRGTNV